jgi:paraquat-inducible protein A
MHRLVPVPVGGKAKCRRCGSLLYANVANGLDRSTALYVASLLLFLLANVFPFIALKYGDRVEQSLLISAGLALQREGMPEIGVLVLLTSVVFPFLSICGMLYLLLPTRFGFMPPAKAIVWRVVRAIAPWSLMGVFMLGLLVSVLKLQDLAMIVPGVAFYSFIGLLVVSSAATASFDPAVLWQRIGPVPGQKFARTESGNASEKGLLTCHTCDLLVAANSDGHGLRCPRCKTAVHAIDPAKSLSSTWAYLSAATLLLIPANVFPVMSVMRFGQGEPSTIIGGVMHLIHDGAWPLGLLVFFASIVVPVSKILAITFLLVTVQRGSTWRRRDRTMIYRMTEAVGAWSMVDIFLVGILVALVRMDGLATIYPGIGASFFGAAVVMTMMAAHAFDPRLLWFRGSRHE